MSHAECEALFEASRALVERSGLARYSGSDFVASRYEAEFEDHWRERFDPKFGRYMAWVLFAVGAENLAKAACVCHGVVNASSRATLGRYTSPDGYFQRLREKAVLHGHADALLREGYRDLKDVRNRDAHSYREGERRTDFPMVKEAYVPAFNVLVKAMKRGGHTGP